MFNWINSEQKLPPLYQRVLIWTKHSCLLNNDRKFVQFYCMYRIPERVEGNHEVPYSWACENGGWEFGHNVTHWAEVEGPNA